MTRIAAGLFLAVGLQVGLQAQTVTVPWGSYGHDPQHTGLSTIGAQRLEAIKWSTPVDQVLAGSSGTLYIHYGSPLVTAFNTVLVPVRTSSANTYSVEALSGATGNVLYTLPSDYTPPPHNWIPSYGPALSQGTRLYYAGAGGTVYYRDQPDSASGPSGQIAFYGNALYAANAATFAATVMISTPITADAAGNIYFGFDVTGANPANLTSGLARIGANGSGTWISARAAAQGDANISEGAMNCAPAISNDGSMVYFAVSQGNGTGGYLVALDSTGLTPIARVRLKDPQTGQDAMLLDDSSASPTVGPDGDVYYGVVESACCANDDRGWLLHFNATLDHSKTPGAFGWDTTASVVPAHLVASYQGPSSYLLFTKYNNYQGIGPGDGQNKIAVLDPNSTQTDPVTGATVMLEVITILGKTPAAAGGVREWCINSGAIDPFQPSAIANSEDGVVYRWDFASNTFTQQVRLTAGVGEAYTPSAIGADGTAYAINDAYLFAVGQAANLVVTSTHASNFAPGQNGAIYTLTVTNTGSGATNGAVVVTDTVPAGLTPVSINGGAAWTCTQPAGPCNRSDSLAAGASYSTITLTVNVAANAPGVVTNTATVSSDGAANSVNSTSNDVTFVGTNFPPAAFSISKTHNSPFGQGQSNATYTVMVSNGSAAGPASGTVTVTEMLPSGLSLVSMAGLGWFCPSNACMRGDSLAPGAAYPPITVTVGVAIDATSPQINGVMVAGGGSSTASTTDTTTIAPVYGEVTIQTAPPGLLFTVDGGRNQQAPITLDLPLGVHSIAVSTNQAGPPGTLYVFTSWSDNGAASHNITVGAAPVTYTATFNTQYALTLTASPVAGGTFNPSTGVFYNPGTVVSILAVANTGYQFVGWTGPVANAGSASTTVTMTGPQSVTASFAKVTGIGVGNCSATGFALTVNTTTPTPASITCTVSDTLNGVGINNLSISGLPNWLTANLASNSLAANGSTTLTLTPANLTNLNVGTLGPPTIVIAGSPANGGASVSGVLGIITLGVFPQFSVNPTSLTFDVPTLAAAQAQTVAVTDSPVVTEPITVAISTSTGTGWLAATAGNTPLNSVVTVTTAALAAGSYSGNVAYASGSAPGVPSVPVTVNVGQLALAGGPIIFNHVLGVTPPGTVPLSVSAGPAAINWVSSTSGDCAWLTDSTTSSGTPRGSSFPVTIGYTAAGATTAGPGSHVCTLSFSAAASYNSTAPPVTTTVTLNVFPSFMVTPPALTFDLPTLSGPQSQTVSLATSPSATEPVTASAAVNWLSATGGNTPFTSTVTVAPSGATANTAGTYNGSITYASGSAPGVPSLPVVLNVGQLTVTGGPVNFQNVSGVSTPAGTTINVSAGPAAINWVASAPVPASGTPNCNWLTQSATSGTTPRSGSSQVSIGYTQALLPSQATVQCTIGYSAAASYGSTASPIQITVTVTTSALPLNVTPSTSNTLTVGAGSTTPLPATYQISTVDPSSTPPDTIGVTVTPSAANPAGVFTTNLSSPTTPTTLTITAYPTGLGAGTYTGNYTVSLNTQTGLPSTTVTLILVVLPQCQFTIAPSAPISLTNAVPSDGSTPVTATGTFTVTPGPNCTSANTWSATSSAPWLTITSGASGNGAAAVTGNFSALSNPLTGCAGSASCGGPLPRTATILISPSAGTPASEQVTQSGSSAPILDRQVTALYQSMLGRDPDPGGYSFWTGSGSGSLSQMADEFLTSPEAFNKDFAVLAAYQAANGVPPAYAQYASAVASIRLGTQTVAGLFTTLTASNSTYSATNLYLNLLGRAPTASETSACTVLATCFQALIGYPATVTPVGAANNEWQNTGIFVNLQSAAGDHTNGLYITMLYFVILDRDTDPSGLAFWTGIANRGGAGLLFQGATGYPTRFQILGPGTPNQGFIGSQEFQGLFQ